MGGFWPDSRPLAASKRPRTQTKLFGAVPNGARAHLNSAHNGARTKIVRVFEFVPLNCAPDRIRTCAHGSGGGWPSTVPPVEITGRSAVWSTSGPRADVRGLFVPKPSHGRAARAAAGPTWEAPSVDVRWRPQLSVMIVTHLVTRSLASWCHERLLRRSLTTGSPATPEVSCCFACPRVTATRRCSPADRARNGHARSSAGRLTLSMRTPGGEVICGRWGRSLSGGSLSESFSVDGVAVLVCCTASGPVGVEPRVLSFRFSGLVTAQLGRDVAAWRVGAGGLGASPVAVAAVSSAQGRPSALPRRLSGMDLAA